MKLDPFSTRARNFILSLIKQRDYLLLSRRSRRNPDSFLSDLKFLRTHLEANGYHTDLQMARFWMNHNEKVLNLMPGQGSTVHESLMNSYTELNYEAIDINFENLFTPDKQQTNTPTINP